MGAGDVIREDESDANAEVARALRTCEELRTGKSRMLTEEETVRFFVKLERKWGKRSTRGDMGERDEA